MAQWKKERIQRENGDWVDAQVPVIVSASRSTDIPKFYADWFFKRLEIGYSAWTNPFNGVRSFVSYSKTRFIVFWSKDPKPLLKHLDFLEKNKIGCYIQFTLNDYVEEKLERGVPSVEERIDTFKLLANRLGKGHVIWRFDPLMLTDRISIEDLLRKIEHIGDALLGYTEKLVFSFADISAYKKVKTNLEANGVRYTEWADNTMMEFAQRLSDLNKKWHYELATCGERIDLEPFNIKHNHCVDDNLIIRLAWQDHDLMEYLGVSVEELSSSLWGEPEVPNGAIVLNENTYAVKKKDNRDKGQRLYCGCMASKDIGEYNTCPHLCEYCYANTSKQAAVVNWKRHNENPWGETIKGD